MTTFRRDVRTTRTIEYRVRRGTNAGNFAKVYDSAYQEYKERNKIKDGSLLPDCWATIDADDENIIIRFILEDELKTH